MKKLPPISANIKSLQPYQPGKPIAELERELGISGAIKLASNECPLGSSPKALEAINRALPEIFRYPDGAGYDLRLALAQHHNLPMDNICLGNGSNEIIEMLCRAFIQPGDHALAAAPSFLMYEKLVQVAGGILKEVPLDKDFRIDLEALLAAITPQTRLLFINNPDNPAGTIIYQQELAGFLDKVPPGVVVVLDEAYIDFADHPDVANGENFLDHDTPIVVMRTFSKIAGLAGLRIGYGLADAEIINYFNRVRQPFNTSVLAQAAACGAIADKQFMVRHRQLVIEQRQRYYQAFDELNLFYLPSQANFVLVKIGEQAARVAQELLLQGIIVRAMQSYNLPEFLRISIGLPTENLRCLEALRKLVSNRK